MVIKIVTRVMVRSVRDSVSILKKNGSKVENVIARASIAEGYYRYFFLSLTDVDFKLVITCNLEEFFFLISKRKERSCLSSR